MRILSLAASLVLLVSLSSPVVVAAQSSGSLSVIQMWYTSGTTVVGGSQVWTYASTNLTMNATFSDRDGASTEEITEFHVHVLAPGKDLYPSANGTNPFPFAQVTAFYDTAQVIRDPNQCVPSNNSVGFECNVPHVDFQHQVVEIRLTRLLEFSDIDGDGAYSPADPVVSQMSLDDRLLHYAIPHLYGLNDTAGVVDLPIFSRVSEVTGNRSQGWIGQTDGTFRLLDGLAYTIQATGPVNLTITGYQWLSPRSFQGTNMTPGQVKMEFDIGSYPFQTSNSRLALELQVTSFSQQSSTNWSVSPWNNGEAIGSDAVNTTAVFAWAATALADGAPAPVFGSVVPFDALSRTLFLAYSHGDLIQHDPVLAITDKRLGGQLAVPMLASAFPWAWVAFGSTLGLSAVLILVVERRKR
jgi:hypothetical protein